MTRSRLASASLAGERALIRPHRVQDAPPAFALLHGQQDILRWLVWDGPRSVEELGEYYRHWRFDAGGGCDFRLAIEERAGGRLAGSMALRLHGAEGEADIGYWVGLPFQGAGLGGEALRLVAHLAFAHLGVRTLLAWVFVGNLASRRVLERCGFTLLRTVPGRARKGGELVDEWHFALTRGDWRRTQSGFRPLQQDLRYEPEAPDPFDSPAPFDGGG